MRKRIFKIGILCLGCMVVAVQGIHSIFADTPKDITSLVDFGTVNVYVKGSSTSAPEYIIKDDVKQENAPVIKVTSTVHFEFGWEISTTNLQQMSTDDYFYVTLPEYFHFSNSTPSAPLTTKSGKVIGILEMVEHDGKKKLKATLNDGAFESVGLEEGYLYAVGMANAVKDGVEVGQGSRPTIDIEPNGGGQNPMGEDPVGDNQGELVKNGYSNALTGSIRWSFNIFRDNHIKALNGAQTTNYTDVIFEDQLSLDQTLTYASFSVPIYLSNSSGQMSGYPMGNIPLENVIPVSTIQKLVQGDTENDTEFESRIRTATKLCYGVTSSNKVIINLKNIPNMTGNEEDGFLIKTSFMNELDDNLATYVANGLITQQRADLTRTAYQNMLTNGNGGAFGINISIDATTTKNNGEYLYNKAKVSWSDNTNGVESNEVQLQVQKIGGGAEGIPKGTFLLTKEDGETNIALKDVEFVLEKKNNALYEEYGTYITDEEGNIKVENLVPGEYRIKEIDNPNTLYGDEIAFNPEGIVDEENYYYFEIVSSATNGIEVTAYNYISYGDVILTKTDSKTSAVLKGAEFTLQKEDGTILEANCITDENGQIQATGLIPGKYQFIETKAPTGYILSTKPLSFEIVRNQQATLMIEMMNDIIPEASNITDNQSKELEAKNQVSVIETVDNTDIIILIISLIISECIIIRFRQKKRI
ncbi:MAG: collagen binding domain-containing protein [Coprobacillaceae bacterium]